MARRAAPSLTELEREFLAASEAAGARERTTRRRRAAAHRRGARGACRPRVVAIVVTALFAGRERDIAASRDLATKSATLLATDPGPRARGRARGAAAAATPSRRRRAVRQATLAHRATRVDRRPRGPRVRRRAEPGRPPGRDGRRRPHRARLERRQRPPRRRDPRLPRRGPGGELQPRRHADRERRPRRRDRGGRRGAAARATSSRACERRLRDEHRLRRRRRHARDRDLRRPRRARPARATARCATCSRATALPSSTSRFDRDGAPGRERGRGRRRADLDVAGGRAARARARRRTPVVLAASFSPDGARVATADFSGAVRLWDASSGRALRRIAGRRPAAGVGALQRRRAPHRGRRLRRRDPRGVDVRRGRRARRAARSRGSGAGGLRPRQRRARERGRGGRDAADVGARRRRVLAAHPGTAPLFSRDGALVVSGDVGGPIHVWSAATGAERELAGHGDASFRAVLAGRQAGSSARRSTAASCCGTSRPGARAPSPTLGGREVRGRDRRDRAADRDRRRRRRSSSRRRTGARACGSRGHRGYVNALVFSPDGQRIC